MGWREKAERWAEAEQGKHICACGCDKPVKVKWFHYWNGPPATCKGHSLNRRQEQVAKWIADNQGKHHCQCGCGGIIPIKVHHHVRGIPRFLHGHSARANNPMAGCFGAMNPMYKGGRKVNSAGYVCVLTRPGARGDFKYDLEHRLVMEQHLGRKLADDEVVHHRNSDKTDNRIENLELMTNSQHSAHHARRGEIGFGYHQNWRRKPKGAAGHEE